MIISHKIENFGHMTTATIYFESRAINFVGNVMYRNYDFITFMLTSSKLQPCLLKQPLMIPKKFKKIEIMYQNAFYISIS